MIEYKNGIHIIGTNLWLDSRDSQELCFVSHAHVDHLGSHSNIIVSRPTARFYEHRMRTTHANILEYNQQTSVNEIKIEIFPAGHILGSSQILVVKDNTRIVYTGDFKLKRNETTEKNEIKEADILIMEATYGDPKYLFPDRQVVINQICTEIDKALDQDLIPIIIAYSLGKGQEIAKVLGDRGYSLSLHNTIYDLLKVYEDFGIQFKNYEKFSHNNKRKVIIMPPYVMNSNVIKNIKPRKTFLLSGWALDTSKIKYQVDISFPMSDHADFNELIEYVRCVNPKEIYVTHGNPKFANYLSEIGYKASYLGNSCKVGI